MSERGYLLARACFIVAGLACVGCEVWGAFDFMWEKHGRWNSLVAGSRNVFRLVRCVQCKVRKSR